MVRGGEAHIFLCSIPGTRATRSHLYRRSWTGFQNCRLRRASEAPFPFPRCIVAQLSLRSRSNHYALNSASVRSKSTLSARATSPLSPLQIFSRPSSCYLLARCAASLSRTPNQPKCHSRLPSGKEARRHTRTRETTVRTCDSSSSPWRALPARGSPQSRRTATPLGDDSPRNHLMVTGSESVCVGTCS